MSEIRKKFYHLFWTEKSCRNLFLLSKEELLDTTTVGENPHWFSYSSPLIIVSNADHDENHTTIKLRTENLNIHLDGTLEAKINYFKPIFENFFNAKFKKSVDKFLVDLEKKPLKTVTRIMKIFSNESLMEKRIIELLQFYGFVGKQINSFKDIEKDVERQFMPNKANELLNEQTLSAFLEAIKMVKELYINYSYKKLYSTKQVLTNVLDSEDDFNSRIRLFNLLYESGVIATSSEDAFIECSNCDQGTYRGVFQLKMNPKKLKDLRCPICTSQLTYFVPYRLHDDIYSIVKSKDGLLLDAYCQSIANNNFQYKTNQVFLEDIEIDCLFSANNFTYVVETKMYKQNTTRERLKNKMRASFGKLLEDTVRLQNLDEFTAAVLVPTLLVNVIDSELIGQVEKELKEQNSGPLAQNARIINIEKIIKK